MACNAYLHSAFRRGSLFITLPLHFPNTSPMFHRFLITQMPLFGFQFLGRSWGSLGEVFSKHFPSRNPFVHGLSERLGEVGRSFSYFHFQRSLSFVAKWRIELLYLAHRLGASVIHLPSSFLPLTSKVDHQNRPRFPFSCIYAIIIIFSFFFAVSRRIIIFAANKSR